MASKLPVWVTKWQTVLSLILAVLALCSVAWGGFKTMDSRYQKALVAAELSAKAALVDEQQWEKLNLIAARLEQKILSDRISDLDGRIWDMEDRNGCHTVPECEAKMTQGTRDQYRKLIQDRKETQDKYDKLGGTA